MKFLSHLHVVHDVLLVSTPVCTMACAKYFNTTQDVDKRKHKLDFFLYAYVRILVRASCQNMSAVGT